MAGGEFAQHLRQQRVDAGGHETDHEFAHLAAVGRARELHRFARARQNRARLDEEGAARMRQRDLPLVAREQPYAQFLLERADRERQRRLRDREPLRRAAEVQFVGERDEVAQRAQLQAYPPVICAANE